MNLKKFYRERRSILNYAVVGCVLGAFFAMVEYYMRLDTDDPQQFLPLVIRAVFVGLFVIGSIKIFEILLESHFAQKTFLYLILIKSIVFTISTTFWLVITNGVWFVINGGMPLKQEIAHYLRDDMYFINILSVFLAVSIIVSLSQINSLHRKGELIDFILGRYHNPREVERIFCFIDLKGSTTIAEKLGHFRFASFLKDYYSDITDALRKTNAQVYQYVGDEIVLSWSFKKGFKDSNMVHCFFQMKDIIKDLKQKYISKYGFYPEFKAGIHGGPVIVTWIGELKKEIVYIGDVLNTTARIQEDCKRLGKDFLISEGLLSRVKGLENIKASFVEETIPRGKEESIKLYSLEMI